jgi:hypothetical protein
MLVSFGHAFKNVLYLSFCAEYRTRFYLFSSFFTLGVNFKKSLSASAERCSTAFNAFEYRTQKATILGSFDILPK